MTFLHSIILGVIEGITEYLPISSTGHLIIASRLLGLVNSDFLKTFEISIQLGAILAVVFLYWKRFLVERDLAKKVLFAFLPTGIIGFALYKVFKSFLLENVSLVIWSLFIGGMLIFIFEVWYKKKQITNNRLQITADSSQQVTYKQAFLIGLFQSISIIPGVSRAAATIVGGMLVGLDRKTVVEFSFLLAVPTMIAATGFDFIQSVHAFSFANLELLAVGFFTSFLTAVLTIRFFLRYVKNHDFIIFAIYRVLLASALMLLILM